MKRDEFKHKAAGRAIAKLVAGEFEHKVKVTSFGDSETRYNSILMRSMHEGTPVYTTGAYSQELEEAVELAAENLKNELRMLEEIQTHPDKGDAIAFAKNQLERRAEFENPEEKDFIPGENRHIDAAAERTLDLREILRETEKIDIAKHRKEFWDDILGEEA